MIAGFTTTVITGKLSSGKIKLGRFFIEA